MPNAWITHVRDFADKKKMKYTEALMSAECKAEYQKNKPKTNDEMKMPKPMRKPKQVSTTTDTPLKAPVMAAMPNAEMTLKPPRVRKLKQPKEKLSNL